MNHLLRPKTAAAVAFALGIALTALVTVWQARGNKAEAQAQFETLSRRVADDVVLRMRAYEYALRGTRGAALGAGGLQNLTRQRFSDYSRSRDIAREFPGARGFGLVRRIPVGEESLFVETARRDGWPEFSLRQIDPHAGERFIIQYLEPIDRNREAIGLDIASERRRREAAEAAMVSGNATLTEPITLVQATSNPQRSFLLLLPIYEPGSRPVDAESRKRATIGWSMTPLVVDEVLKKIHLTEGTFTLALRDLGAVDTHNFFASPGSERPAAGGLSWRMEIPVYGRTWVAETRATPEFWRSLNQTDPRHVAWTGTAFALLLSLLAMVFSQSRLRATLVRAEQARRSAIVESSADAIIGESLDGVVTDWNRGAELLFGYPAELAIGRHVAELLLPPERAEEDAAMRTTIVRGDNVPPFETTRRRRDGSLVDVSVAASPIMAGNRRCTGVSMSVRDISEPLRMRHALVDLNAGLERQVAERTQLLDSALHDLRAILDAVPSMIGYWDRNLVNRVANRSYARWFDMEPAELHGRHMRDLIGDDLFERNRPHAEGALRGERQTFERFFPKADGSGAQHWLSHYLPDIVDGEVKGFYVLVHDVSELTENRMRLAAAQRDNTALLHTLHHHASILVTSPDGSIMEVNDNFCRISGYEREELIGKNPRVVNSGVQDREFWAEMWRTISSGQSWRREVCNRAKDGSLYWMDCTISPFFGDDGRIEKYISIRTDITARKRFEEALHLTNTRFEIASSSAGIGVWEFDAVHNSLTWDDRMFQIYGCDHAFDLDPFPLWRSRLYPEDRARIRQSLEDALAGRRELDIEFRIVIDGGEVRHLRAAARVVRDDNGNALRMTGVNFDVTERVRAELDLRETSTLLKTVLASASGVAIIAVDPHMTISVINTAAERLLGYSSEEMVGKAKPWVFHDAREVEARARELGMALGRRIEGVEVFTEPSTLGQPREWTFIRKDGRRIPVSLVISPMHDHTGALFGYVGISHDVSAQKEYEHSLREAVERANQANKAKSQFLANMSHEIRTPMNAILGMLTLVQRTELSARQLDYVTKTEAAAQSLLGLLNDILDFSKVEAGKMELDPRPFQLDKVMRNLGVILSANVSNKEVEVLFDVASDVPRDLIGDDMRLQQILINLGGNAVKFTERGEVVIGVRLAPGQPASPSTLARLEFSVRDTGIGISPEHQTRIFSGFTQAEASTTRRFGGTGLGLSICQRLVAMMGGDLRLASTPGQGTTFSFTIELPLAPVAAPPQLPAPPAGAPGKRRALVVDDHRTARDLLQAMAQSMGWVADAAGSGEEAVAMVAAANASGDGYSAIFVDWQMPGIDGWETCRRIRETEGGRPASVVVMVTAHGREALARRSEQDQKRIDGFLVKPITASMLLDAVADAGGIAPMGTAPSGQRLAGMRLLLAEDNINNQQIALELLEAEGASVRLANNGQEAVALVAASVEEAFDAVLMDLQMPEMDGFEATQRIRQWLGQATLPIIAMTANAMADDREACLAAGMNDHVGKPFDLAHLIEVLCRHTGRADLAGKAATAQATQAVPDSLLQDAQGRGIELAAALRRTGGNEGAYLRMLRSFLKEAPHIPDQLAGHLSEGRVEEAGRLMHTMKGLAGTVGARTLAEVSGRVESLLDGALDTAEASQWVAPVRAAFDQACTDLSRIADALEAVLETSAPAGAHALPDDPATHAAALVERLSRLAGKLTEGDMAAMDLLDEIQASHGPVLGDPGQALADAVVRLDFEQALVHCRELAVTFGAKLSTRIP